MGAPDALRFEAPRRCAASRAGVRPPSSTLLATVWLHSRGFIVKRPTGRLTIGRAYAFSESTTAKGARRAGGATSLLSPSHSATSSCSRLLLIDPRPRRHLRRERREIGRFPAVTPEEGLKLVGQFMQQGAA